MERIKAGGGMTPPGTSAMQSLSQFEANCASDVLACGTQEAQTGSMLPSLAFAPPTDLGYSNFFPDHWSQLKFDQSHNAVFSVAADAPPFLSPGAAWASPLTGDEFLRLARGVGQYGSNGGESWGAEVAQWLGNVTGVSVVDGIVYVEESANEIFALDAATGIPIWRAKTVNSDMGDALVESINGRPIIFVAAGDVGFTLQSTLNYANQVSPPTPASRGANFSAVYAIDGLTGKQIWSFHTKGEVMPTPIYYGGSLFFNTGDGHLYAVDAATGSPESVLNNPHLGFSSMSSGNYYVTPSRKLYVIFGTQNPNFGSSAGDNMLAVNETDPRNPSLAWQYNVAKGVNTGLGDVPVVVDQQRGLVLTDALVNTGTSTNPQLNIAILAVNARSGALVWKTLGGGGPAGFVPVAFKGSVPMVHGGNLYVGDLLNQTYQSYDELTGALRWSTLLQSSRDLPGTVHQPRGGAAFWDGKIIEAEGLHIWTLDPNTGKVLNDFIDPGYFGVWGITSPVIVGDEMYLGAISGWAFAVPATYVTTHRGPGPGIGPAAALSGVGNYSVAASAIVPKNPACYYDSNALPTGNEAAGFPRTWLAYAGGQQHNAVVPLGSAISYSWQSPLDGALGLAMPPRDVNIFGAETATEMTSLAFGAGTGVSPANGMIYVGSDGYTVNAFNAATGKLAWSYCTINADYGQPLVTPHTVIVSSGDPWFNFTGTTAVAKGTHTHVGASLQNLHGLDPWTGQEKWTFYTKATDMMTPLYLGGNIYWVDGDGNVWGINADTGQTIASFEDANGHPTLNIGGYNAIDSANIVQVRSGPPLMVVGTGGPSAFYAINLDDDTVYWKLSSLPSNLSPYITGFSASSPVVDTRNGLIISSLLVNADTAANTVTDEAIALDAADGNVVWAAALGTGPIPYGYTAATPFMDSGHVIFADPVSKSEVALNPATGQELWSTPLGEQTKAPGAIIRGAVVQPAGPYMFTLDERTGEILNTLPVGGDFKDNGPSVIGDTLYVGNSWGWVMAFPLGSLGVP
ncbi:MAG: outer membrane protein assembly factor BamB family protein [Acidiferrobacteraceae bacterium]